MDNWVFLNKTNNIIYNKNKRKDYNLFNPQTFDISQLWYDTDTVTDNTDTIKQKSVEIVQEKYKNKMNTNQIQNINNINFSLDNIKKYQYYIFGFSLIGTSIFIIYNKYFYYKP
jgi:hypothetical protein